MIVVSNTSPLNDLALIDLTELLPSIFGQVLVPDAVLRELRSPAAPAKVVAWIDSSPVWLESRSVIVPSDLKSLGPGEQEAIALAESFSDSLVLLGEKKARQVALPVAGTLGVLDTAAKRVAARKCRTLRAPVDACINNVYT